MLVWLATIRTKEAVLTFQNFSSFIGVVLSARSFSAQSDRKDRAPIRGTGRSSISGKDGVWEGPSLFIVPTRREVRGKQHKSGSYLVITVGPISQCPPTHGTKYKEFKKCKWQRKTPKKNQQIPKNLQTQINQTRSSLCNHKSRPAVDRAQRRDHKILYLYIV